MQSLIYVLPVVIFVSISISNRELHYNLFKENALTYYCFAHITA